MITQFLCNFRHSHIGFRKPFLGDRYAVSGQIFAKTHPGFFAKNAAKINRMVIQPFRAALQSEIDIEPFMDLAFHFFGQIAVLAFPALLQPIHLHLWKRRYIYRPSSVILRLK